MSLKHTTGDLLKFAEKGKFDVIVQGCNCFCTMGSGIARQIRENYPRAYEADLKTKAGDRSKLGTYSSYDTKRFVIINGYTQFSFNRGGKNEDVFEYEAFEQLLETLARDFPTAKFGFPYIGMGLAGGNPDVIIPMLELFAEQIESTGGSVTLVEYK